MTLPQLYIPSDKLPQVVANYNRVEVFRTSRVASMLPCSSCVYTYNYDISDSGTLTFFKETLSSFSGTA